VPPLKSQQPSGHRRPAILSGYIFGFSPYILAQMLGGHLHLELIFPVPIALYLVARWFEGTINSRQLANLIGLTLAVQFSLLCRDLRDNDDVRSACTNSRAQLDERRTPIAELCG
jgi:hypothetical protein